MSNAGQAILTIGGTAVGAFFGNPQLGYLIGSAAGQALFPTDLGTVSGPRLNDLAVQTSTVGAPIPIVYGTFAISGNLIWSSGIIESVSRKKQGGKGGPTQTVKTYSYSVNCAIGVCEGAIGGILRVWADAKLIYDARPQQEGESMEAYTARLVSNAAMLSRMEVYLGDNEQLADPTIESFEGAGNISAFRGLAYVVFNEFQLADYGNRIPNFRFEVTNVPVPEYLWDVSKGIPTGNEFSLNANTYPLLGDAHFSTTISPPTLANPYGTPLLNMLITSHTGTGPAATRKVTRYRIEGVWGDTFDPITGPTIDDAVWDFADWEYIEQMTPMPPFTNWAVQTDIIGGVSYGALGIDLYLNWSQGEHIYKMGLTPAYQLSSAGYAGVNDSLVTGNNDYPVSLVWEPSGYKLLSVASLITDGGSPRAYTYTYQFPWSISSTLLDLDTVSLIALPYEEALPSGGFGSNLRLSLDLTGMHAYVTSNDPPRITWIELTTAWDMSSGTRMSHLDAYSPNTTDLLNIQFHPMGHMFWSVERGNAADGTGQTPRKVVEYILSDPVVPEKITLGQIVDDICNRCGLRDAQIDVSDLTEFVDGYCITRPMSGRDAISPLRTFGWFDCVESSGVLKWPTRGKAAVAALTVNDLAAHESNGTRPPSVETDRTQELELPRRLRVHYLQTAMNYEPGEQSASRRAAGNLEIQDLEVAVSMSDQKAAQISEVVLYDLWVSRSRHRIFLDQSWLKLDPADAITVPIDGRQERLRIVDIGTSLTGVLRLECVRDDDGVYESFAVGSQPAYSGTGGGTVAIVGEGEVVLMDLPLLRDSDNDAGYYAAIHAPDSNTFSGAALFRSPDGVTYESVATTTSEAYIGTLDGALPAGPTGVIDEGNTLVIDGLPDNALESIAEASLLAGLNAAAIGADGRWEIIQFRDANLVGSPAQWQLTGLVRGRRGTEWAVGTSQDGDTFVLLDAAIMRVPMNIGAIGAARNHKAVLVGTSLEAAAVVSFTGRGVALEPFSPVQAEGEWDGGDFVITWIRRGRIGQELPGGADIPLSEETEAYEVDILDGPDVVRTLSSVTPTVTYTAAQITADFGSPPAGFDVRIYQLSAVVGRGYPLEASL